MPEKGEKISELYFYTKMPKIHLEHPKKDELYERAFLERNEKNDCEYCRNTTTWD